MYSSKYHHAVRRRRQLQCLLLSGCLLVFLGVSGEWSVLPFIRGSSRATQFKWEPTDYVVESHTKRNQTKGFYTKVCNNTVQGRVHITDNRGYTCLHEDLDLDNVGCCQHTNHTGIPRFSCSTCDDYHCCESFEFCVGCCLDPENVPVLQRLLAAAGKRDLVIQQAETPFDLCRARCRTSSRSVEHENRYKTVTRHCFG